MMNNSIERQITYLQNVQEGSHVRSKQSCDLFARRLEKTVSDVRFNFLPLQFGPEKSAEMYQVLRRSASNICGKIEHGRYRRILSDIMHVRKRITDAFPVAQTFIDQDSAEVSD